jgi:uncharacterized membrane protein YkoI
MKRQFVAILLMFTLLMSLSACAAANAVQTLDILEDKAEARLEAAENKLEESLRKAAAVPESTIAAAPVEKLPSEAMSREEAEKIALDHLGFTADQVTRLRTEYEIDDGLPQFDIEFHQGDWEYEFEIHAENGRILSYDKDHKYD